MIKVHSRHTPPNKLEKKYPGHAIVDVTSRAPDPWVRFSPFFPHGGLNVPGRPGEVGESVEGIWQGLKVFGSVDVDPGRWSITTMKRLKRSERAFGPCRGHRVGDVLLGYREARYRIFLPLYLTVLEQHLSAELQALKALGPDVVLLDYMTNCDVDDLAKPLSHAGLIAAYVNGSWPTEA
jgi:hypothetical protein